MKNKLIIDNFLILKHIEIDVNQYTIFIGPQASGKSVVAKILFIFHSLPNYYLKDVIQDVSIREVKRDIINDFIQIFPQETWDSSSFQIKLKTNIGELSFCHEKFKKLKFTLSDSYNKLFKSLRKYYKKTIYKEIENKSNNWRALIQPFLIHFSEQNWGLVANGSGGIYIPAGRSFFANLSNLLFTILINDYKIDFFIKSFGSEYEKIRKLKYSEELQKQIQEKLLKGTYYFQNNKEFIYSKHHFSNTELSNASSGQQELLPILLTLFSRSMAFFTIEEPEAHIFPDSQYELIRFIISRRINRVQETAFLFTTHSPYILTTINNLAYAGYLEHKYCENIEKLNKLDLIYPQSERIPYGELSAYYFSDGSVKSIIDNETMLINSEEIDNISNVTEEAFSNLMDLDEE